MGRGKKKAMVMPKCAYGVACTRKDCVYTHPPRPAQSKNKNKYPQVQKSGNVCLAFLSGLCAYGRLCHDLHPESEEERERIIASFRARPCHFGLDCHTPGCLYGHPTQQQPQQPETPALQATSAEFRPSMASDAYGSGGALENHINKNDVSPFATYEERLAAFYGEHDPKQVPKIPLMLTRFAGREESLLESLQKKYGALVPNWGGSLIAGDGEIPDQGTTTSGGVVQFESFTPPSALEGALRGQHSQRLPLSPPPPLPQQQQLPADPMAAMAMAALTGSRPAGAVDAVGMLGLQANFGDLAVTVPTNKAAPVGFIGCGGSGVGGEDLGGFLGAGGGDFGGFQMPCPPAAAPSVPEQRQLLATPLHFPRVSDLAGSGGGGGGGGGGRRPARATKPASMDIPLSFYTRDVTRDAAAAYAIPDALQRFEEVNGKRRQVGVMDLHFQSTRTAGRVLECLLDAELASVRGAADSAAAREGSKGAPVVWVITGSGHHTDRNTFAKAGALREFVEQYLAEGQYRYAYGKDPNGYVGAFAVFG